MTARLSNAAAGDMIDWTGVGVSLKALSNGGCLYQGDGSHTDWSMAFIGNSFTGTGNGTFNHGCTQYGSAVAPNNFFINASSSGVGISTIGIGAITTTQCTLTLGASNAWRCRGLHT